MDNIKTSPPLKWWEASTLSKLENLIQIFFRKDGAYATCGLLDSTRIPNVPKWDETKALPTKGKGRKARTLDPQQNPEWDETKVLPKKRKGRKARALDPQENPARQKKQKHEELRESKDGDVERYILDHSTVDIPISSEDDEPNPCLRVGDVITYINGMRDPFAAPSERRMGVVTSVTSGASLAVRTNCSFFVLTDIDPIKRVYIVDRDLDIPDDAVFEHKYLIPTEDKERERPIRDFCLIDGCGVHPKDVGTQMADKLEAFIKNIPVEFEKWSRSRLT